MLRKKRRPAGRAGLQRRSRRSAAGSGRQDGAFERGQLVQELLGLGAAVVGRHFREVTFSITSVRIVALESPHDVEELRRLIAKAAG